MGWTFCWFRVCLLIFKFSNGWMWSKFSLWGQILQREWSSMFNFRSLLACSHTSVAVNCSQQLQGFEDDNLFVLTELRRRKTQPLSWPIYVGIRFLALWIMDYIGVSHSVAIMLGIFEEYDTIWRWVKWSRLQSSFLFLFMNCYIFSKGSYDWRRWTASFCFKVCPVG